MRKAFLSCFMGISYFSYNSFYFSNIRSNLPIEMLPDERDQNMIDFTVNLWTNFATFHDPTPSDKTWLPCEENSSNCYVILDDSKLILERDPKRQKRIDFWKNIPSAVVH